MHANIETFKRLQTPCRYARTHPHTHKLQVKSKLKCHPNDRAAQLVQRTENNAHNLC